MPLGANQNHFQKGAMLMKQEENRPMDKLKSDYESIPVPTEAKERMLAGIAQAKKNRKV